MEVQKWVLLVLVVPAGKCSDLLSVQCFVHIISTVKYTMTVSEDGMPLT